jgi:hypothetical protein
MAAYLRGKHVLEHLVNFKFSHFIAATRDFWKFVQKESYCLSESLKVWAKVITSLLIRLIKKKLDVSNIHTLKPKAGCSTRSLLLKPLQSQIVDHNTKSMTWVVYWHTNEKKAEL